MSPEAGTEGRYFLDANDRLWLHEWTIATAACLMDGFYKPLLGGEPPERRYVTPGEGEPGLVMLDEPIAKTLDRYRMEGRLVA